MRLKTTKIKNFQSLSSIEIEHGDLTVLWGSSDLGKSACIRAIRALHRNTASPDNVKHGQPKLKVEQEFEDGTIVSFEKSKTTNAYHVGEKLLSKVGRDVPEDVSEVLKTDRLVLDKDQALDLNFNLQFDQIFLLNDSSSMVTKTISSLSGIHYIYSALREASSQAQKLKSQASVLSDTISLLEKFDSLQVESDEIVSRLEALVKIDNNIKLEADSIIDLGDLVRSLTELEEKEINPFEVTNILVGVQDEFYRIKDLEMEVQELKELLSKADKKTDYGQDFEINLHVVQVTYGQLISILSNIGIQETGYNELIQLLNRIDTFQLGDYDTNSRLNNCIVKEQEIKNKIKVCTACGRVL
jgi:hypothetical protein